MRRLLVGLACCSLAACGSVAAPTATPSAAPCALPQVPALGAGPIGTFFPPGPAVDALHGGPSRHAFSLDSGALRLDVPTSDDRPAVAETTVECEVLASAGPGELAASSTALQGGLAIGYGRVTIQPAVFAGATGSGAAATSPVGPGDVGPTLPPATPYDHRLAWVVVVTPLRASSCALAETPPATTARRATDYGYEVFIVDARTGGDAVVYNEGAPGNCPGSGRSGPSVGLPIESVSVPWTLVSRDPNGYAAQLVAQVLSCDGYGSTVLVDRDDGKTVRVTVGRPVGPPCGHPLAVPVRLHAATVNDNLPATLIHAALGPYLALPSASSGPPQTAVPGAGIKMLSTSDNGSTIVIPVASAVVTTPDVALAGSVTSTNPSVLGPLDATQPNVSPFPEFRAWKAGKADLVAPGAHPWVVHVVVR